MNKLKKILTVAVAFTITCGVATVFAAAKDNASETVTPIESGFVNSDGVKLEYAIYGLEDGEPLLLLPPNNGSMHSFDTNVLPEMSKHYKVITISVRGCGNSERGKGRLTFDVMSSDLVNILNYLNIDKTNIFGFSDGGNLGIVFTLQHQDRVKKLAVLGANINTCGTKTHIQLGIDFRFINLSIQAWVTKDPAIALKRDIVGMMVGQPNLTFKDLHAIKVPVLNMYGEHDMFKRWHSQMITKSIDGAQEIMIKGAGHGGFEYTDTVINPALLAFFG